MSSNKINVRDIIVALTKQQKELDELRTKHKLALEEERRAYRAMKAQYESLRPHWAKGFDDSGRDASAKLNVMLDYWELLGVEHHTAGVNKLKYLIDYETRGIARGIV